MSRPQKISRRTVLSTGAAALAAMSLADVTSVASAFAAAAPTTVSLVPTGDTFVRAPTSTTADLNHGADDSLRAAGPSNAFVSYLRFDLRLLAGAPMASAKLRIKPSSATADTYHVRLVTNTTWSESSLTYATRPPLGALLGTFTNPAPNSVLDIALDVSQLPAANELSLGIEAAGAGQLSFSSRHGLTPPRLVVTFTPPVVSFPPAANRIQLENQRPGTTDWELERPAPPSPGFRQAAIEGYAWAVSAQAGDVVPFSVSTTAPSFQADVYRLGWYQGYGARHLLTLANLPGRQQPAAALDPSTGLLTTNWPQTFSLPIPSGWVSGAYLVKLTASTGYQAHIPLVIKDSRKSAFLYIRSTNTEQAYNLWGGVSLYHDLTHTLAATRGYKVSFDRPFSQEHGAGQVLWWEYPMIRYLERQGYDLTYLADLDVALHPDLLRGHRGILLVGHPEYWSKEMRDNLEAALSAGVNLANFAANAVYNQVRFEPRPDASGLPNRVLVCYKSATKDPLTGVDNSRVTVAWRQPPVHRPEQLLLGAQFRAMTDDLNGAPFVVADPTHWVFSGTGVQKGTALPGLVGYEFDAVISAYPSPPNVTVLSSSPIVDHTGTPSLSNAVVHTWSSGARVVNLASIQWSFGVEDYSKKNHPHAVHPVARKITDNILHNFLAG